MKTMLALVLMSVSLPAMADVFADRQAEINRRQGADWAARVRKESIVRNRKYLAMLDKLAAKYGGAHGQIACKTQLAMFAPRRDNPQAYTVFRGRAVEVTLVYTNSDLTRTLINGDNGSITPAQVEPEISVCEVTFSDRQRTACSTFERDAERGNDLRGNNMVAECITASLKKTENVLGPLF